METINTAAKIRITAPAGATFIQATDAQGRKAVLSIEDVHHGANPFKDCGIVQIVAGIKSAKGWFQPMPNGTVVVHDAAVSETKPKPTVKESVIVKEAAKMTMSEIIAEHNKLTGKTVKRFSDRKSAERRLADARASADAKPKPVQPPADNAKRSESIAVTWRNKKVAAARSKRDGVTVGGKQYRSVPAAFLALGLPMCKMIKFRLELKAKREATFERHLFRITKTA